MSFKEENYLNWRIEMTGLCIMQGFSCLCIMIKRKYEWDFAVAGIRGKIQPYVADSERCPKTGGWENEERKERVNETAVFTGG